MPNAQNVSEAYRLARKTRLLLNLIFRLKVTTIAQLKYWLQAPHETTVARLCSQLAITGFIKINHKEKPYSLMLASKGARYLQADGKTDWPSFAATQQIVLKNDVEIWLREYFDNIIPLNRTKLWQLGLNPGVGEHAFRSGSQLFFILIDDYLMESNRISHCLSRAHTPSEQYYDVTQGGGPSTWADYADRVFVFSCDEDHLEQHQAYLDKQAIKADCHYLPATWGIAV